MENLNVIIKELPIELLEENIGQIPDVPENPRRITDEDYQLLKKSILDSPEMETLNEVKVFPLGDRFVTISGSHRLRVYKEIKRKKVVCKILPEDTPAEKLCEYIMKENMQYASNDPYKLKSWDKDQLKDWGVDVPNMESDMNIKDFFKESENHHLPQDGFKITVTCPQALNEKKEEIFNLLKEIMKPYGGVKIG